MIESSRMGWGEEWVPAGLVELRACQGTHSTVAFTANSYDNRTFQYDFLRISKLAASGWNSMNDGFSSLVQLILTALSVARLSNDDIHQKNLVSI